MGKYYAQTNSLCYKAALPMMVRQKLYTPSCKKRFDISVNSWHNYLREVIHIARQRTIKYPPKREKFTKKQIQRAVDKVIRERLEREAATLKTQTNATSSKNK